MPQKPNPAPDNTAVRVALWRALHVQVDPPPHVFEDEVGLKLASPDDGWRSRPDMSPFTRPFRASILARARFVEDLVVEQAAIGVGQYVILGAGLDTFAQRRPELGSRLLVFEVDQPSSQAWKRQRLIEVGFGIPSFLRFVPVDFEAGEAWWERLAASGFDSKRPAVVASTGVSMYLTKDAIAATLHQIAALPPGSTLAMSFMLPIELADPEVRPAIASGGGCTRERHAVRQFFHALGDARASPRSRLSRRRARVSGGPCRALFREQDGRPSTAEQLGGASRREDVVGRGGCDRFVQSDHLIG